MKNVLKLLSSNIKLIEIKVRERNKTKPLKKWIESLCFVFFFRSFVLFHTWALQPAANTFNNDLLENTDPSSYHQNIYIVQSFKEEDKNNLQSVVFTVKKLLSVKYRAVQNQWSMASWNRVAVPSLGSWANFSTKHIYIYDGKCNGWSIQAWNW